VCWQNSRVPLFAFLKDKTGLEMARVLPATKGGKEKCGDKADLYL